MADKKEERYTLMGPGENTVDNGGNVIRGQTKRGEKMDYVLDIVTQTSHIKNGIRTLKNQYFSL